MPVSEILNHPNAEMRRILIEIRGWERFLEEANAKVLDHDNKREAFLYRVDLPTSADVEDEPVIVIRVTDSTPMPDGSRRNYFIRVPPDTKTCIEALSWTFNMSKKQYILEVET
jgi:hypothetical protein